MAVRVVVTTSLHIGELLTGRITTTLSGNDLPKSLRWTDVLNGAGSIDEVTITEDVVRKYDLRQVTHGSRCFLAVEVDGRIKQAGPIWSRTWDWEKGQLTLAAAGIWSWLDKRIIYPPADDLPLQQRTFTLSGKSLGGIGRGLVDRATDTIGCTLPIVLPADEAGDHTETWPVWSLARYGEELRQLTQRATAAPDIAFRGRRRSDDLRFVEWTMQVGTEAAPALTQGGPEWVFDTSASKSPVLGISTDEDATAMAEQVWVTGNGSEEGILIDTAADLTLIEEGGWVLTEADESHPTVEEQATLNGHADNFLARVARPIEVFKVWISADSPQAREVLPGDYCRVVTKGDVWLGDMDRAMRVKQVSGDLSNQVLLEMFPMQALL